LRRLPAKPRSITTFSFEAISSPCDCRRAAESCRYCAAVALLPACAACKKPYRLPLGVSLPSGSGWADGVAVALGNSCDTWAAHAKGRKINRRKAIFFGMKADIGFSPPNRLWFLEFSGLGPVYFQSRLGR